MDAGNGTPILWKCLTTQPSFGPTDDCLCIYLRPSSLTAIIRCWCFWNKICVALAGSSLCKSDWLQTQRLLATASQVLVLKDIHHHDSLQLDVLYSAFSFLNKKKLSKILFNNKKPFRRFACICAYVHCVWNAYEGQARTLDPLEVEFSQLWAAMWVLGIEPRSTERAPSAPNLTTTSLDPAQHFLKQSCLQETLISLGKNEM